MKRLQTNELSQETKSSMLTRIITAICLAIVCVPCLVLGSWYFFGLCAIFTICAAFELTHIVDLKGITKVLISFITIVLTLSLVYYIFLRNVMQSEDFKTMGWLAYKGHGEVLTKEFNRIDISVMIITLMAAVYFIVSFVTPSFKVEYVFYFISMVLVVAIGIQSFLFLRFSPFNFFATIGVDVTTNSFRFGQSMFLVLYIIIGVMMNDIGAYFIGVLFGKHKMNERISPHKTWEGCLGGVVVSLIASTTFALVVAYLGKPLLPIFDLNHSYFIVGISLLLPVISDTGDFVFSAIKRSFGVKDFSNLLPGHGGILDRLDSLIFAAGLVSGLIVFINFFIL